jgi:ribonucleoside-diphosphate reductase alpha chain
MWEESMFDVALAEEIWTSKYRFRTDDGSGDSSFAETAARVAKAVAAIEAPDQKTYWEDRFRDAVETLRFIPAGRVLAGAGTGRSVTLFNCFVMGTIPDSLSGIFEHLKEAALTMQQGGGVGMDFSTIRPSGSPVHGVGADASGPLTFMDCWDSMCRTVHSAGQRRGAM